MDKEVGCLLSFAPSLQPTSLNYYFNAEPLEGSNDDFMARIFMWKKKMIEQDGLTYFRFTEVYLCIFVPFFLSIVQIHI